MDKRFGLFFLHMNTSHVAIPAMLGALALMGIGCNPFASMQQKIENKIGETVVEKMIEAGSGGKVDVDATGEGVTFRDNKTGEAVTFGTGTLPAGFPEDLPTYPGGQIILANVAGAGKTATLSQTVEEDVDTVFAWYDSTLKADGYTTEGSATAGLTFRKYVKGDTQIVLTVYSQASDDGKTYSSITAAYEVK